MKTSASPAEVLIFVEDPGAANYVAPLPKMLDSIGGIHTSVLARGSAADQLRSLNTNFETVSDDVPVEAIIAKWSPNLILVGTSEKPDSLGLALIDLGKEKNIPTIGVVDSRANVEHRFAGGTANPKNHEPDIVVVPDEPTRQAFVTLGYRSDKIFFCGHPHYDFVRDERQRLEKIGSAQLRRTYGFTPEKNQKTIVFCAEISAGLAPRQFLRSPDYTLSGDPGHSQRTEIVLDEFLAAMSVQQRRSYLVLRLHPKNNPRDFAEYLPAFDRISEDGSSVEVVFCADLVVGMTSMILTEAALIGRPTVSIVPRQSERDWLPTIGMGVTKSCTTRAEILEAFREDAADSAPDAKALTDGLPRDSTFQVGQLIEAALERGATDHAQLLKMNTSRPVSL